MASNCIYNILLLPVVALLQIGFIGALSLSSTYRKGNVPPPPPWSFEVNRIHYQFRTVPVHLAQQTLAAVPDNTINLLSLDGITLGGLFAVEYTNTPVGPYREVAVLSALVTSRTDLFSIGAWASHIFVDSKMAATYGQKYWGLPATVVPIDFSSSSSSSQSSDEGIKPPTWIFSDDHIKVQDWKKVPISNQRQQSNDTKSSFSLSRLIQVDLPSYSGCLLLDNNDNNINNSTNHSPLLRYPLSIIKPESISVGLSGSVSCEKVTDDGLLRNIIEKGNGIMSFDIQNVQLKAGKVSIIS